jgi:hypothetical protein
MTTAKQANEVALGKLVLARHSDDTRTVASTRLRPHYIHDLDLALCLALAEGDAPTSKAGCHAFLAHRKMRAEQNLAAVTGKPTVGPRQDMQLILGPDERAQRRAAVFRIEETGLVDFKPHAGND